MPFFFLFKQKQEVSRRSLTTTTKPHVYNPNSLYTIFYFFLLTIPLYSLNLCKKYYKTSPIYTFFLFHTKITQIKLFLRQFNLLILPHRVSMDRPLCRPHVIVSIVSIDNMRSAQRSVHTHLCVDHM